MRKKDREINDQAAIDALINRATVIRIAVGAGGVPYVVPMNFGYREGVFYLHSSPKGKKVRILRENNRICFELDGDATLVPAPEACRWTCRYWSIIGYGTAKFLKSPGEKRRGLAAIMEHYAGRCDMEFNDAVVEKTEVISVAVDRMTAKANGFIDTGTIAHKEV